MAVQSSVCKTWLETPEAAFLMMLLKLARQFGCTQKTTTKLHIGTVQNLRLYYTVKVLINAQAFIRIINFYREGGGVC